MDQFGSESRRSSWLCPLRTHGFGLPCQFSASDAIGEPAADAWQYDFTSFAQSALHRLLCARSRGKAESGQYFSPAAARHIQSTTIQILNDPFAFQRNF